MGSERRHLARVCRCWLCKGWSWSEDEHYFNRLKQEAQRDIRGQLVEMADDNSEEWKDDGE